MSRRSILVALALVVAASLGFAQSGHALSKSPSLATANPTLEFAGYEAAPANGLASASTTFVVPTVTGCSDAYAGQDLIFGVNGPGFVSGIDESCNGATAVYQYIAETNAGTIKEPATAGDTVVASSFQTASRTEAEVHDLTNGQYWVGADNAAGEAAFVQIGVFDANAPPAIDFGKTTMSVDQVNGDYLGFESPEQDRQVDSAGHTLIASGSLTSDGTKFTLTWKRTS